MPDTQEQWQLDGSAPRFPSVEEDVQIQLAGTPLASLGVDPGLLSGDVAAALAPYVSKDGLAFPQEVHVLVASRSPRS